MSPQSAQTQLIAVSRASLISQLGIREAQFKRDLAILQSSLSQFDLWEYQPNDRAFNQFEIDAFMLYRGMVRRYGSKVAIRRLFEALESYGYSLNRKQNYHQKRNSRHPQNSRNENRNQTTNDYISDLLTR